MLFKTHAFSLHHAVTLRVAVRQIWPCAIWQGGFRSHAVSVFLTNKFEILLCSPQQIFPDVR